MEDPSIEECESGCDKEVAPAVISVHPLESFVAVAVGSELRVFDINGDRTVSLLDGSGLPPHTDSIRAICFGAKGRFFASAGDDKLVKVWKTDSWQCVCTVHSEKRVTAVSVSHDGLFVTFADKFGVIWVASLEDDGEDQMSVHRKAAPLLGHYCSIITSLEYSPDGKFIATADRDFKIRISVFPKRPLTGAHEIQSYCLGHTDYVSCLTFVCTPNYPEGFLLSGSGDSTVRFWDFVSGCLLDTCEVGAKAGLAEHNGKEEENHTAITDLCSSPDGSLIAVATQSLCGIVILSCNFSSRNISIVKVVNVEGNYSPTSISTTATADYIWSVMGASNLSASGISSVACVRVFKSSKTTENDSDTHEMVQLKDEKIPGSNKLLETLQGSSDVLEGGKALEAAAEAVKSAMRNLLIKKQYSVEKMELRKKSRNDRKLKQQC